MTEQTTAREIDELSVMKRWGEHYLVRKLDEVPEARPACIVSHPDAGGPCQRPSVMEVYGLPFCEAHGAHAASEAVYEAYDAAVDETEGIAKLLAETHFQNTLALDALRGTEQLLKTRREGVRDSEERDRLVREAYPLIEERVDSETREWIPGDFTKDAPVDTWGEALWMVHCFMRMASERSWVGLEEELEPLRERCAAQFSYALAYSDRKLGTPEKRRKAREKAAQLQAEKEEAGR